MMSALAAFHQPAGYGFAPGSHLIHTGQLQVRGFHASNAPSRQDSGSSNVALIHHTVPIRG